MGEVMDSSSHACRSHAGERRGSPARRIVTTMAPRRTLFVVMLLLLVAAPVTLLAGCTLGGDTSSLPGLGERAGNDKISVTVHSLKVLNGVTSDLGSVITPDSSQDAFVIADLTVQNRQDSAVQVDPENLQLWRTDNHYQRGAGAASTTGLPHEFTALKARPLGPGKKIRGMVAFVFPKGTALEKIVYAADPDIGIGLNGMTVRAPVAKRPPRLGQTARGGGLALTVRSVTYPQRLTHGLWTTAAKKGFKMVVVDLSVKNLDYRPSYKINPLNVVIVDNRGGQHMSSFSALGMAEAAKLQLKRLKPGARTSGKVVISIKKRLKVKRIRYAVGVLGPPLEIAVSR